MENQNQLTPERFENGFNAKAPIAALFVGFIMMPAAIYMGLIAGTSLGPAAQWVTLILFIEIAKRSFITLKRQEIYIILLATAALAGGGAFGPVMYNQYFIQSPYAKAFGLTDLIPRFAVPPAGSPALLQRTFFHSDWVKPIAILVTTSTLHLLNSLTLGYIFFRVTSDFERLEFPMAPVQTQGVLALADLAAKKDTQRWRIFTIGAMLGVIYGAFYVFIPTITGLTMSKPFMLIPIPFVDFTSQLGSRFPAAIFGMVNRPGQFPIGFVLPFWVVVGHFIGSVGAKTIANPLIYKHTDFLKTWQPGMGAIPASVSTTIDFWVSVTIGTGLAVFVISIISIFIRLRSARGKGHLEKTAAPAVVADRGDYPIWIAIGLWFFATLAYVLLVRYLVPDFPIWIPVSFGFLLTPALTYISARMYGITGVSDQTSFPYLIEGTYILSGYRGAAIWYAPLPYFNHGGIAQGFKQMEILKIRFTSWYKTAAMTLGIMLFCSFTFWSIIWRMAPIPSTIYPYVQRMWPQQAMMQALWISSTVESSVGRSFLLGGLKKAVIGWTFLTSLGLAGIFSLVKWPMALFYGILGGIPMLPHNAVPMFLGGMIGRYFFARRIGPGWRNMTPLLTAGYGCGIGLAGAASVAIALIAKTVFQLVF